MKKTALLLITVMALLFGMAFFADAADTGAEPKGTEVYIEALINLSTTQSKRASSYYNDIRTTATFRVARADMSPIVIDISEGEMHVKARNIKDPQDFMQYLTRPGKWSLLGSDNKEVLQFKRINKVLMDLSGEIPAVIITLSRPAIGMAEGLKKGEPIAVEFAWDDERIPLTMSLIDENGKSVRLENSSIGTAKLWQIRAALTLAPYPCPLEVTEFRYGDDLLRQILGF